MAKVPLEDLLSVASMFFVDLTKQSKLFFRSLGSRVRGDDYFYQIVTRKHTMVFVFYSFGLRHWITQKNQW